MRAIASILAGGGLLLWPALYNGWPFVFTDTGAFMFAALERWPQWDKPIAYALFLHATSWRVSYWGTAVVQSLVVSHLAWLMLRVLAEVTPLRHLLLVAGLALLSSAPWFTTHLMPDVLAPIMVLAVVLLGLAPPGALGGGERAWLAFLAALGAAGHLSHLGVLLGLLICLVPVRALCGMPLWPRAGALPLGVAAAGAIAFLVGSNALMWGKPVISPFGSVFPLARQLANGPAVDYLRAHCPGYVICAHLDRVGTDSDRILWDRDSPLWAGGDQWVMAPEASRILAGTLREHGAAMALNALRDSAQQLVKVRIGDSLISDDLDRTVLGNLQRHLPQDEARFLAARQVNDRLAIVLAMNFLILATMVAALAVLLLRWRRGPMGAAVLLVLLALLGNAVICGATSKPHHRYQARIAWLVPLMAGLALAAARPAADKRATGTGAIVHEAAQRP